MPSRVRSPTPANTETPPCWRAMLWISSWISTVLPTPAPPKRPTLPPRTYGAIRSMTLIPVSKISTFGDRSRKPGGSRWIGERSTRRGRLVVDGVAEDVPDAAERLVADRHRDRPARVDDVDAAREAVGGIHRDGADAIVAEVLLHLRDQRPGLLAVARGNVDPSRVVDLRQRAGEHGVDHDALDLEQLADALLAAVRCRLLRHASPERPGREVGRATRRKRRGGAGEAPRVYRRRARRAPPGATPPPPTTCRRARALQQRWVMTDEPASITSSLARRALLVRARSRGRGRCASSSAASRRSIRSWSRRMSRSSRSSESRRLGRGTACSLTGEGTEVANTLPRPAATSITAAAAVTRAARIAAWRRGTASGRLSGTGGASRSSS